MSAIHRFDAYWTHAITSVPTWLEPFFLGVTVLGDPIGTVGIGVAITTVGCLRKNKRLALSGAMIWLALGVGSLIKLAIDRTRPLTDYAAELHTSSFPSGHTTGAVMAYGLLAYLAWRRLPQPWNHIAAGLLMFIAALVGMSRVVIGAHYPTDVIGGIFLGGVALAIVILVMKPKL